MGTHLSLLFLYHLTSQHCRAQPGTHSHSSIMGICLGLVVLRLSECVELSTRHRPVVTVSRPFVRVHRTVNPQSSRRHGTSFVCQSAYNCCPPFVPSRHRQSPFVRVRITVNRPTIVPDRYRCSPVSLSPASLPPFPFVRVHITVRTLVFRPVSSSVFLRLSESV